MTSTPRFPAAAAVRGAYASLIDNGAPFIRFSLLWGAISLAFGLIAPTLASALAGSEADTAGENAESALWWLQTFGELVINFVAAICVCVVWTRFIILGEPLRSAVPSAARVAFRYAARLLVISIPPLLAAFVAFGLVITTVEEALADGYLDAVAYVVSPTLFAVTVRLQLALPASAIGADTPTIVGSWTLTRGHTLPLFAGLLACAVPFAAIDYLIGDMSSELAVDSILYRAATLGTFVTDLAWSVVEAAFIAFAYMHFTQGDARREPASVFS